MKEFSFEAKKHIDKELMKAAEALADICKVEDGVLPPLQWNHDLNTNQEMDSWFLAWDNGTLIGVLSIFAPLGKQAEFSGCVHPEYRRRRVFSRLNDMASPIAAENGITSILYMVERGSKSGQAYVATLTDKLDHTEYTMYFDTNSILPDVNEIEIRKATPLDFDRYSEVSSSAFKMDYDRCRHFVEVSHASEHRTPYVGIVDGKIIAISTISLDGENICINGVGVLREDQGKGYGKALMTGLLHILIPEGRTIVLDVDSTNEAAYPLYKGLGFKDTQVIDYWVLNHK